MKLPDFLKSTNFWFASLMVILSLFGGGEDLANQVVMAVVGTIAAFGAVRQFVQSAKFGGWKQTLIQGNTLNYLFSALTLVGLPSLETAIPALKDFISSIVDGNWGLAISRGVALLTILFYLFMNKGKPVSK